MPQPESLQLAKRHSNCKVIRAGLYRLPILLILLTALAQSSSPGSPNNSEFAEPAGRLRLSRHVQVAFSGGWVSRTKCDANGNIYVRLLNRETQSGTPGSYGVPIRKIGPEGTLGPSFEIPQASDLPADTTAIAYFASSEGGVYLGAFSGAAPSVFVLGFSPDGSLISTTRLTNPFFVPRQIAVFRSGEFLLSGYQGPHGLTPFTAVFARNGQLLKNISEPEDEDARKRAEAGESGYKLESGADGNEVVVHGDVAMGPDGNAYLLRSGPTGALVYVISSNGAVLRKIRISSPQSRLTARDIKAGPGALAISFQETWHASGVVEDTDLKGNTLGTYSADDQNSLEGTLVCYTKQGLTFMNNDETGNVYLSVAER